MPTFRVTSGSLTGALMSDNYPGNELPGVEGPVDPGYGISGDRPSNPIVLPPQPPQVWPPISVGNPIAPIIDNTLPVQPGTIWPSPGRPPHIDAGLPPVPGHPDNTLPGGQGGQIDNALPSQTFWMLCYAPSLGWKYVAVDPSLRPGHDLPPHAQPK